ncbi:MAG: NUDIX hydrolase [Acidilobaceae archaeon]
MNRVYPETPLVGVGCLVIDRDGRILLVKRAYPPGEGKWSIPGGHLELGEDIVEAAVRELEEETRVKAEPRGIVNVDTLIVRDRDNKIKYHYVLIDVLMVNPKGDPEPSGDVLEVGYYTLEDSLKLDLTRSVRGLVEKIIRGLIYIDRPIRHERYEYIE